jgi:hypothetical protein
MRKKFASTLIFLLVTPAMALFAKEHAAVPEKSNWSTVTELPMPEARVYRYPTLHCNANGSLLMVTGGIDDVGRAEVRLSLDGGQSWTVTKQFPSGVGNSQKFFAGPEGYLYLFVHDTFNEKGSIYRTPDGGETWETLQESFEFPVFVALGFEDYSFAVNRNEDIILVVSNRKDQNAVTVLKSEKGKGSFRKVATIPSPADSVKNFKSVSIERVKEGFLVFIKDVWRWDREEGRAMRMQVLKSVDEGVSWTYIDQFEVANLHPEILFVSGGFYGSTDYSADPLSFGYVFERRQSLLSIPTFGIRYTRDSGKTWNDRSVEKVWLSPPTGQDSYWQPHRMINLPKRNMLIAVFVTNYTWTKWRIGVSSDEGSTFEKSDEFDYEPGFETRVDSMCASENGTVYVAGTAFKGETTTVTIVRRLQ